MDNEATDSNASNKNDGNTRFLPEINLKVKELPSKSLPYPDNCEIKYRPYAYGEVKKISQSSMSMKEVYRTLLDGVECSNFDKFDLTLPDALFIGVLRKISTLGVTDVYIPYKCTKCNGTGKHIIKTDNLEFLDLEIPDLPVVAQLTNGEFEFGGEGVRHIVFNINSLQR